MFCRLCRRLIDIVFKNTKKQTKLSRVEVNSVATPPLRCKHDKASTILALTSRYGQAQYDDGMSDDDCCYSKSASLKPT